MVFTAYTKRRILLYHGQGLCAPTIAKLLEGEGIIVSRRGVAKFILRVSREVYITRELRTWIIHTNGCEVYITRELRSLYYA